MLTLPKTLARSIKYQSNVSVLYSPGTYNTTEPLSIEAEGPLHDSIYAALLD